MNTYTFTDLLTLVTVSIEAVNQASAIQQAKARGIGCFYSLELNRHNVNRWNINRGRA